MQFYGGYGISEDYGRVCFRNGKIYPQSVYRLRERFGKRNRKSVYEKSRSKRLFGGRDVENGHGGRERIVSVLCGR